MTTRIMPVLVCTILSCALLQARAATEVWRYDGQETIMQIVTDGKGGGAFVREDTNMVSSLVWLDKKGTVIYSTVLSNAIPNQILMCTRKSLLYADERPDGVLIQVDKDGGETVIAAPNGHVTSGFLNVIPWSSTADAKGFFGILFAPPNDQQELIRFKNK